MIRKTVRIFSIFLLFIFIITLTGCSKSEDINISDKKKKIALIVKMNYGYHWMTVKLGADTAAQEFNVDIDYNGPNDEEDIEGQIELVNKSIKDIADGKIHALILAASDFKALSAVTEKAYSYKVPVIIIDSEVDTDKIHCFIGTDNFDAGRKAGEKLVEVAGKKCKIAIMSFVKGTRNAEKREEGLLSIISRYPDIKVVAKEYCLSDTRLAFNLAKKILSQHPDLDAFVTLNSISSEGVAEAVDQLDLEGKVKIISFDNTPKEIDYLERGIIQATVTQDPFSMGYLGVKYAVDKMNGKDIPPFFYTKSTVIDINNMYLPENQKLLFPLVK